MGQRLNIELQAEGVTLANAYYHWSGYTSSALRLTSQILNNISILDKYDDHVVGAIKLLEVTGAGLSEDEYKALKVEDNPEDKFKSCVNRNEGIISVSEKGIETTRLYEEARVTIDLGEEVVIFDAMFITNAEETEEEDLIEYYGEGHKDMKELDMNNLIENISFEDFPVIVSKITELLEEGVYNFKVKDTPYYYSCIE